MLAQILGSQNVKTGVYLFFPTFNYHFCQIILIRKTGAQRFGAQAAFLYFPRKPTHFCFLLFIGPRPCANNFHVPEQRHTTFIFLSGLCFKALLVQEAVPNSVENRETGEQHSGKSACVTRGLLSACWWPFYAASSLPWASMARWRPAAGSLTGTLPSWGRRILPRHHLIFRVFILVLILIIISIGLLYPICCFIFKLPILRFFHILLGIYLFYLLMRWRRQVGVERGHDGTPRSVRVDQAPQTPGDVGRVHPLRVPHRTQQRQGIVFNLDFVV